MTALRHVSANHAPLPSREFRRRAWRLFEQALDRHLASRHDGPRITHRPH